MCTTPSSISSCTYNLLIYRSGKLAHRCSYYATLSVPMLRAQEHEYLPLATVSRSPRVAALGVCRSVTHALYSYRADIENNHVHIPGGASRRVHIS